MFIASVAYPILNSVLNAMVILLVVLEFHIVIARLIIVVSITMTYSVLKLADTLCSHIVLLTIVAIVA